VDLDVDAVAVGILEDSDDAARRAFAVDAQRIISHLDNPKPPIRSPREGDRVPWSKASAAASCNPGNPWRIAMLLSAATVFLGPGSVFTQQLGKRFAIDHIRPGVSVCLILHPHRPLHEPRAVVGPAPQRSAEICERSPGEAPAGIRLAAPAIRHRIPQVQPEALIVGRRQYRQRRLHRHRQSAAPRRVPSASTIVKPCGNGKRGSLVQACLAASHAYAALLLGIAHEQFAAPAIIDIAEPHALIDARRAVAKMPPSRSSAARSCASSTQCPAVKTTMHPACSHCWQASKPRPSGTQNSKAHASVK